MATEGLGFTYHISILTLKIGNQWAPVVRGREISTPATFCARQSTSTVAHSCSNGAGGGGNGGRRHWFCLGVHDQGDDDVYDQSTGWLANAGGEGG